MSDVAMQELELEMSELDDVEKPAPGEELPEENTDDIQEVTEVLNDPQMIADIVYEGVSELFDVYPSLEKVYTKDKCLKLSEKSCAVANKHGVSMLGFLGKYIEEFMLGFAMIQLTKATYIAIDHDMSVAEKAKENEPADKKVDDDGSE